MIQKTAITANELTSGQLMLFGRKTTKASAICIICYVKKYEKISLTPEICVVLA